MTEQSPSEWLASIAEVFEAVGVEWTIVGALAANRYRATPRFTTDLDTMAEYNPRLAHSLESAGYHVTIIADLGVERRHHFRRAVVRVALAGAIQLAGRLQVHAPAARQHPADDQECQKDVRRIREQARLDEEGGQQ